MKETDIMKDFMKLQEQVRKELKEKNSVSIQKWNSYLSALQQIGIEEQRGG
jgi:hypothetical protein